MLQFDLLIWVHGQRECETAAKTTALHHCLLLTDPQTSQTSSTSTPSQGGARKSLCLTIWISLTVTFAFRFYVDQIVCIVNILFF